MNDDVPIPTKPALAETLTEVNCFPSSCTAAFPSYSNQTMLTILVYM